MQHHTWGACALRETSSAGDEDKRKSRMQGNGRGLKLSQSEMVDVNSK
jgi:hypothetical protein